MKDGEKVCAPSCAEYSRFLAALGMTSLGWNDNWREH
jgi:hypothetical protein